MTKQKYTERKNAADFPPEKEVQPQKQPKQRNERETAKDKDNCGC